MRRMKKAISLMIIHKVLLNNSLKAIIEIIK